MEAKNCQIYNSFYRKSTHFQDNKECSSTFFCQHDDLLILLSSDNTQRDSLLYPRDFLLFA